jgi:hypothetical protein
MITGCKVEGVERGVRDQGRKDALLKRVNVELARGEQALVCLRQIERPTSNPPKADKC